LFGFFFMNCTMMHGSTNIKTYSWQGSDWHPSVINCFWKRSVKILLSKGIPTHTHHTEILGSAEHSLRNAAKQVSYKEHSLISVWQIHDPVISVSPIMSTPERTNPCQGPHLSSTLITSQTCWSCFHSDTVDPHRNFFVPSPYSVPCVEITWRLN